MIRRKLLMECVQITVSTSRRALLRGPNLIHFELRSCPRQVAEASAQQLVLLPKDKRSGSAASQGHSEFSELTGLYVALSTTGRTGVLFTLSCLPTNSRMAQGPLSPSRDFANFKIRV